MINKSLSKFDIEAIEDRIKESIESFNIINLMDYTIDSVSGCDISDFYKTVLEEALIEDTYVAATEISDGKYELTFEFENKDRWYISSYAWDSTETIIENLIDNVVIPHLRRRKRVCQNQSIA